MRTLIHTLLLFLILSCASGKQQKAAAEADNKAKIKAVLQKEPFTVHYPEGYRLVYNHNTISYTPLAKDEPYYHNHVYIFTKKNNATDPMSLKEYVQSKVNRAAEKVKLIAHRIIKEESQFGTTYVFEHELIWNSITYKEKARYFKYGDDFVSFYYASTKDDYQKYYANAEQMFNTLTFKE